MRSKVCLALMAALVMLASCGKRDKGMWNVLPGDGTVYTCASIRLGTPDGLKDTVITAEFSSEMDAVEQEKWRDNNLWLDSKVSYKKSFRWFYTEYTFSQTFPRQGYRFPVSIDSVGNKDMVSYWFTGRPDLMRGLTGAETAMKMREIESLMDKWITDNVVEVVYNSFEMFKDSICPSVSEEELLTLRDSVAAYLAGCKLDSTFDLRKSSRSFYRGEMMRLFDDDTPWGERIRNRLFGLHSLMRFSVPLTVKMPGVICGGTDIEITGNTATFHITGERLIPDDYTVSATSRALNLWAVLVSLLIVVAAVFGLRRYRRR